MLHCKASEAKAAPLLPIHQSDCQVGVMRTSTGSSSRRLSHGIDRRPPQRNAAIRAPPRIKGPLRAHVASSLSRASSLRSARTRRRRPHSTERLGAIVSGASPDQDVVLHFLQTKTTLSGAAPLVAQQELFSLLAQSMIVEPARPRFGQMPGQVSARRRLGEHPR